MKCLQEILGSAAAMGLILLPVAAQADEARQLAYINGMWAGEAQDAMEARGFKHESSHDSYSNGYVYSYWWDKSDDHCVRIEAHRGKVESVVDAKDSDCGHSDKNTKVAAAVAGAAILGAIIASKSHHRKNDEDNSGDNRVEFDRGYADGRYNHSYHNNNNSQSYSRGYAEGVNERHGSSNGDTYRGGYSSAASFADLKGARASAIDQMSNRGFKQVDNFTSGNTRYGIWWRSSSRQCVQATIADGRIYDIRDIQTHPKCR